MALRIPSVAADGVDVARRIFVQQLPAIVFTPVALAPPPPPPPGNQLVGNLYSLERQVGGRLGVYAATASGKVIYRFNQSEWFPMCSTFKLPLAGAVLSRVDARADQLSRKVSFSRSDLLPVSPVTSGAIGDGGLSVENLVSAALEQSDNTAANLLLKSVGGPEGLTDWLRSIGDPSTRLDRYEPELNLARPGDPRDTTTARSMVGTTRRLLFSDALSPASRQRLAKSMIASRTGMSMLRAGLPKSWKVGDKTGRGGHGATNDVAVVWPPSGEPVVIAAYLAACPAPPAQREAAIAEVGRLMAACITNRQPASEASRAKP